VVGLRKTTPSPEPSMPKPAPPPDVRLAYAGAHLIITPLSESGQQWVALTFTTHGQAGAVKVPLRDLDDVLVRAKRWGLRLDTPWRDADGLTEPV
jgi:hypothetical protein